MRHAISWGLGLVAVLAGTLVAGCSGREASRGSPSEATAERQGAVTLNLVPVSGVTLNSVHYVVTNSATPPVTISAGDLPTPGSTQDFSFGLSLPVGTGYTISLSANAAETGLNVTCAGSYGPFSVTPSASANFTISLVCHDNGSSDAQFGAEITTDACPRIVLDYAVASPAQASIGSSLNVQAKAHDLDGKAISYSWRLATPSVGTFTPATGASSTLTCLSTGLAVRVDVTANNGECTKVFSTSISCRHFGGCGDGVVEPGETCDTGIPGSLCPADCTYICGDGYAEAPAEDCDPGSATNPVCNETCHFRGIECGNGFLQPGEACDGNLFPPGAPACSKCSLDCKAIVADVCGDGIVGSCEECDDGGPSPTCSNTCTRVSTPACVACEKAGDCFESVDNCRDSEGTFTFTAAEQTACYTVQSCIEKSNCLDGTGTLGGTCYCGTLSVAACAAAPYTGPGSPNGACVKEIQAGMPGVTTNAGVLGNITSRTRPASAAMQRLNCEKFANASACLDTCGFTAGGPPFP